MKKNKLSLLIIVVSIFGLSLGAQASLESADGQDFMNMGDGKCVYSDWKADSSVPEGWIKSDASQCSWELCCKFLQTGYETSYTYTFKKSCNLGATSAGVESEETDKSKCKKRFTTCYCPLSAYVEPVVEDETKPKFEIPNLQISLPTLEKFSEVNCSGDGKSGYVCSIPWLGEYIKAVYDYGVSIAAILAAIVLMAGGVLWLISGGEASKITQAKELIIGSVTGLIILSTSYLILYEVSPALVSFNAIKIGTVKEIDLEPVSSEGNENNSTDCSNCVSLKPIPSGKSNLSVNSDLKTKLTTALQHTKGFSWVVTEAWPPTYKKHKSTCHYNGMCVDIDIAGGHNCVLVNEMIKIMLDAGLNVLNEYTECRGTKTANSTGGHIHVR